MTFKQPTQEEDHAVQPESQGAPPDTTDEVWATVESGAGSRYEGIGDLPDRRDSEFVLPYSDRERLGALFASLSPRLTAVALRLTRDPETAQDVVQNAFEKVLRNGARYRGTARVSTWIHRIVVNEALMWLRSQKRRSRVLTLDPPPTPAVDDAPTPGDALDNARACARLRDELAKLPPEDRDVLERCAMAGVSYAEYAQHTGTHPAAVKSRAHRARGRLRSGLGEALAVRTRLA
jgi:RNA polymerase sigma-70 factor (ECF subfamily)